MTPGKKLTTSLAATLILAACCVNAMGETRAQFDKRMAARGHGPVAAAAHLEKISPKKKTVRPLSQNVAASYQEVIPPGKAIRKGTVPDEAYDSVDPVPGSNGPWLEESGDCGGCEQCGGISACEDVSSGCGGCGGCDAGGVCDGVYGGHSYMTGCGDCRIDLSGLRSCWWARDLSFFFGAQGFKGPTDLGRNGNFGLHAGVNIGGPLGSHLGGNCGIGYQIGFGAHRSNFSGDRVVGLSNGDRKQIFLTAGVFHRAQCGGFQWGVAFDLLQDDYYEDAYLKQIRSETSYRFSDGLREIGYFGAYGTGGDELILLDRTRIGLQPADMFAFFYRRHFTGGGEGRIWAGFTGSGDGLIGTDIQLPIGRSWALENHINYLIPKQGSGAGGQTRESWALSIHLVWYMGQSARRASESPYQPLLHVADNATFMTEGSVTPPGP